ncbi:MAG: hypothetical protein AMXMBFR47_44920 [Planctomycetota bacterium]
MLFTVAPDGQILSEIPHTDADQVFSRTLTATSDGAALLAALRRDASARRTILVLLRRPSGAAVWSESLFTSPAEWSAAEALSVDAAGNVVISGGTYFTGEPARLTVVSFDPQGQVRWVARDESAAVTSASGHPYGGVRQGLDDLGNTFVAATVRGPNGSLDADLLIEKVDSAGNIQWQQRYSVDENERNSGYWLGAVKVHESRVYLSAWMNNESNHALLTLAYDLDGNRIWSDLIADQGGIASMIAANPADRGIYVGGTAAGLYPEDPDGFFLARYSPAGDRIFAHVYDSELNGTYSLNGVVVDSEGRAYLGGNHRPTGQSSQLRAMQVLPGGTIGWDRHYTWPGSNPLFSPAAFIADGLGGLACAATVSDPHNRADVGLVTIDTAGDIVRTVQLNSTEPSSDSFCYGSVVDSSANRYVAIDSDRFPDEGGWAVVKYDASGIEQWRRRVTEWGSRPTRMAMDAWENITVAGSIADDGSANTGDILVVRWRPDGSEVWRAVYDGPTGQRDYVVDMAMSYMGDVYISGETVVGDQALTLLVKFDFLGHFQWDQLAIPGRRLMKVAADDNLLFMTAYGLTCISPDGWIQWTSPLPSSVGCAWNLFEIDLDRFGNVLLVGSACHTAANRTLAVIKYSPTGELRWVSQPEEAQGVNGYRFVLDRSGNVLFVGTQSVQRESNLPDQYLVTGLISPQGATRWIARHYLGRTDFSTEVDVARDDDWAYVMGRSRDFVTLRYDLGGNLDWKAEYSESGATDVLPFVLTLDPDGRTAVTGRIRSADDDDDMVTVCYGAASPPCGGTPACRAADVNADCVVDLADLFIVLSNFGLAHRGSISPADGDMNFDGVTDINDLVSVLGAFGERCE